MPVAAVAIKAIAGVALTAAPIVGAAVGVYSLVEGKSQAKSQKKKAAESQAVGITAAEEYQAKEFEFQERQAGEYLELTTQQMQMQSQASQLSLLGDILKSQQQPRAPMLVTLPAAKTYTPVQEINRAIDRFFRG